MGTPGSGRKRTPVKDRFSAEDEALSNIAREVCLVNSLSMYRWEHCTNFGVVVKDTNTSS
jgi:hypothetical protein